MTTLVDYETKPTSGKCNSKKEPREEMYTDQSKLSKSKVWPSDSDDSFGSRIFLRADGAMELTGIAGIGFSAPMDGPSRVEGDDSTESLLRECLRVSGPLDSAASYSSSSGTVDSDSSSSSTSRGITPSGRGGKLGDTFQSCI